MRIYLAGPLFTAAECAFNTKLAELITAGGHTVWLPQDNEPREKSAVAIFEKDVEGINWAHVVVANMDGPDPDSGTCWECGYAYAKKKPVFNFRTDFRASDEASIAPYNLMMYVSATDVFEKPFGTVEDVANATLWWLGTL